jgi:hypothetical protein
LPGNGTILAVDPRRKKLARAAARQIMKLVEKNICPRDIVTAEAIDDAGLGLRQLVAVAHPLAAVADAAKATETAKAGKAPAVKAATEWGRAGKGPVLVESVTYRWRGHSKSDRQAYRTRDEVKEWQAREPVFAEVDYSYWSRLTG